MTQSSSQPVKTYYENRNEVSESRSLSPYLDFQRIGSEKQVSQNLWYRRSQALHAVIETGEALPVRGQYLLRISKQWKTSLHIVEPHHDVCQCWPHLMQKSSPPMQIRLWAGGKKSVCGAPNQPVRIPGGRTPGPIRNPRLIFTLPPAGQVQLTQMTETSRVTKGK